MSNRHSTIKSNNLPMSDLPLSTRINLLQKNDPKKYQEIMQRLIQYEKDGNEEARKLLGEIGEDTARNRRGYEKLSTAMTIAPFTPFAGPVFNAIKSSAVNPINIEVAKTFGKNMLQGAFDYTLADGVVRANTGKDIMTNVNDGVKQVFGDNKYTDFATKYVTSVAPIPVFGTGNFGKNITTVGHNIYNKVSNSIIDNAYRQSSSPITKFKFPFKERWDVVTHRADPNAAFFTIGKPTGKADMFSINKMLTKEKNIGSIKYKDKDLPIINESYLGNYGVLPVSDFITEHVVERARRLGKLSPFYYKAFADDPKKIKVRTFQRTSSDDPYGLYQKGDLGIINIGDISNTGQPIKPNVAVHEIRHMFDDLFPTPVGNRKAITLGDNDLDILKLAYDLDIDPSNYGYWDELVATNAALRYRLAGMWSQKNNGKMPSINELNDYIDNISVDELSKAMNGATYLNTMSGDKPRIEQNSSNIKYALKYIPAITPLLGLSTIDETN